MILDETQEELDVELAKILRISMSEVRSIKIASPDSIRIFEGDNIPDDYSTLYKEYKYLNLMGYLRTLMYTSLHCRSIALKKYLRKTKNKICLDFGSGVGSHAIALMENGNHTDILDVDGPLIHFALERIKYRNLSHLCNTYFDKDTLPISHYDFIICTDVLEHVNNPIEELERITKSLKQNGILHLRVSTMIKSSSGHFTTTIKKWKKVGPDFLKKHYIKVSPYFYQKL